MRPLSAAGPAVEQARLLPKSARLYPGLLLGHWYDLVTGSEDDLGGVFLVSGRLERYVRRDAFEVVPVAPVGPGPGGAGDDLASPGD